MSNPFEAVPFALLLQASKRGFHRNERKEIRTLNTVAPEVWPSGGPQQNKLLDSRWTQCVCNDEHSWRWQGHSAEPSTTCERCSKSKRIECNICKCTMHMVCVGLAHNQEPEMQPCKFSCTKCRLPESEFVDDDPDVVFERCLLDGDLGDTMELSA